MNISIWDTHSATFEFQYVTFPALPAKFFVSCLPLNSLFWPNPFKSSESNEITESIKRRAKARCLTISISKCFPEKVVACFCCFFFRCALLTKCLSSCNNNNQKKKKRNDCILTTNGKWKTLAYCYNKNVEQSKSEQNRDALSKSIFDYFCLSFCLLLPAFGFSTTPRGRKTTRNRRKFNLIFFKYYLRQFRRHYNENEKKWHTIFCVALCGVYFIMFTFNNFQIYPPFRA